jgi:hypothetical protein
VAASLLLGLGAVALLAIPAREAVARPHVVDELADWNLTIADAPTPADRRERFRERADALSRDLAAADLSADHRGLAEALFENARGLAAEDHPLAVAERLDAMSEHLLDWMWAHADTDPRRSEAVERHYLRFAERNLGVLRRVIAADAPDGLKRKQAEKVAERIAKRAEARVAKETERAAKKAGR